MSDLPTPALRPYLPADAAVLAEIFQASIEELTGDDYSAAQQAAWASLADDEAAFARRLSQNLTLVATVDGSPVGFAGLKGNDEIDMLYVHPDAAGIGVGALLIDALERLARARGTARLTASVSDTAEDFFKKRGFVAQSRASLPIEGEWLANTIMRKDLATPGEGKTSP